MSDDRFQSVMTYKRYIMVKSAQTRSVKCSCSQQSMNAQLHYSKCVRCRVKTKALIVDPEVEAAQARLEAMRTGRYIAGAPKEKQQQSKDQKAPASSKTAQTRSKARTSGTTFSVRTGASMRTDKTNKSTVLDGPRSPLPPPLVCTFCFQA